MELWLDLLAEYFDGWYADMAWSPVKDEIVQRHLGMLPPPDVQQPAQPGRDRRACRRAAPATRWHAGEPGLWPGDRRPHWVRLVGPTLSAEAVHQAREQARRLGATADFRLGDLVPTGDAGSADAVLCVDAIQSAASSLLRLRYQPPHIGC